jgi:hypothetical protein
MIIEGRKLPSFTWYHMLEFHHIMDKQPVNDTIILQVDAPYLMKNFYSNTDYKHCTMGMRNYDCRIPFDEFLKYNLENDFSLPNFFWCYIDDFYKEYPIFCAERL